MNFARREIEVKIVYCGPAFSGKTTNVEVLHRMMPAGQRGELHALRTDQDRTIFFDYAPVTLGEIAGMKACFKLFTVPGQTFYRETRRVVLQGADAVVFVADSDPARRQANLESFADLEENLQAHGIDISTFPMVVQLNKRDHAEALPVADMSAELNPFDVPVVEAVAKEGRGVLDTLRRISELAGARIRDKVAGRDSEAQVTAFERVEPEDDRAVVAEQMEKIQEVRVRETAQVARMQAAGAAPAEDANAFLGGRAPAPASAAEPAVAAAPPPAPGRASPSRPNPPSAPAATPPAEAPPAWIGTATAALVSGSVGVLVGIAIGWCAAQAIGG